MILTALTTRAFRMHTPRWAYRPTSGDGAARQGGRLNRPGTPALYLSLAAEVARLEYQQLATRMPPGLLVEYDVRIDPVADFSRGYEPGRWDPIWQDLHCSWRKLVLENIEPSSWVLEDLTLAEGAKGIIFASAVAPGGLNLVVYNDRLAADDRLEAYDPEGALPRDQSSWGG